MLAETNDESNDPGIVKAMKQALSNQSEDGMLKFEAITM